MDLMSLFGAESAMGKMLQQPIAQMSEIMTAIGEHMRRGNELQNEFSEELKKQRALIERLLEAHENGRNSGSDQ